MIDDSATRFEGIHCTMEIERPARDLVVVTITGVDVGEFADVPLAELDNDVANDTPIELFIDSRNSKGASIGVSNDWALWLRKRKDRLTRITMLTGSRFIQLTADFVRRFADLEDIMRLTTDEQAFDAALAEAIAERQ